MYACVFVCVCRGVCVYVPERLCVCAIESVFMRVRVLVCVLVCVHVRAYFVVCACIHASECVYLHRLLVDYVFSFHLIFLSLFTGMYILLDDLSRIG